MQRRARNTTHPDQCGAAIMIMLLILVLGAASFLLTKLGKGDARQPNNLASTQELGTVRNALIGYAQTHGGCLPCPSLSATNGAAPGSCTNGTRAGYLPWTSLGFGAQDAWGHRYTYVVDPAFAVGCTFPAGADLSAQTRDNTGVATPIVIPNGISAIVVSHGANGFGSVNTNGIVQANPPASHTDERDNRRNDLRTSRTVMQRTLTDDTTFTGGPFDDLVVWITRDELNTQYTDSQP